MGEVVDEGVLKLVELEGLQIIDKDDEDSRQDHGDQQREDQNHDPGLGLEKLICIEMVTLDNVLQTGTDTNIPINVKKQRNRQGDRRDNKYKYRMKIRSGLFHDGR